MDSSKEIEGKSLHDHLFNKNITPSSTCVWTPGPVIIGAGPSGLAVAACLKQRGVPTLILERSNCIASLWKLKTYDRLRLHLPKEFCELPLMPFPESYPTYPNKNQFVSYLEDYANHFGLEPVFNKTVVNAEFDQRLGFWRIKTLGLKREETEYISQWMIVATGENAEEVVPHIEGMEGFGGTVLHTSLYKSGEEFLDKEVLVVGCGNSGMEVCLDLSNHNARPSLVVRDSVHVLPHQIIGRSTFGLSMWLLKWFPISLVDRFLLLVSMLVLGDTRKLGINRPQIGPLELKHRYGKTPVLDVGTMAKIRTGNIKVCPGIKRIIDHGVEFVDGRQQNFDAIVLATGFRSNVADWLKEEDMFSEKDGFPRKQFPNGWKGESGLYAAGFSRRGLMGASFDAKRIAEDIEFHWKSSGTNNFTFNSPMQNKS